MNLFKFSIAASILCIAASISFLFSIKSEVQNLNKELLFIDNQIAKESEEIHMLKVEVSYLSQPPRIEKLAKQHLQLEIMRPSQGMNDNRKLQQLAFYKNGK